MIDPLFLGLDGGGTKCRARLCDGRGRSLGEGLGGRANIRVDPDLAWASVLSAIREAVAAAGLSEDDFRRLHVGFGAAGAGQSSARHHFLSRPHPFASISVETDAHIAWLGAFKGDDGAILIIGTGSCGYGSVAGKRHYVGGWGYELSDEGSGAAIGRDALRRAIWSHDGRIASTALTRALLREFDNEPEAVVDWVGTARGSDYARFAPLVVEHGRNRDPVGVAVLEAAAQGLSRIANRLLDLGAPALCLVGGLAEPMRHWLPPPVKDAITQPLGDALTGAVLLARQQAERCKNA